MAALEGGRAVLALATGQAAEMTALLTLCEQGDEIVSALTLYGGTYSLFEANFRKLGINTTFVDPDEPENFRRAITKKTKAVYAETLGNPLINVLDIEAVANIAHEAGVPLIVHNTFASPYLCRPFEFGADIVVHSATKYIGGHGTTMGGVIVESGKFPWDNGNFPGMTEPSRGYHGVRFYETFGDFGYTMKARMETLRTFGPALSPFNAWMLLQGLQALQQHPGVERRQRRAEGSERFHARLHGVAEIAEGLVEAHAVIAARGFGHAGEVAVVPGEFPRFDDHPAHGGAVAADVFGRRVHHDVGAELERAA